MTKKDVNYKDPNLKFASDLKHNRFFTKDQNNFINVLSQEQLPTMGKTYLLDVFLSRNNIVEPHYHINASEVIYCISGEVVVSLINIETNELKSIRIKPQQAVTIPQGWWHYFQATEDHTHVLTIYDTSKLETVWGSDVLRITPPEIFAHAYCLNQQQVQQTLGSIKEQVIIGPPKDCQQSGGNHHYQDSYHQHNQHHQHHQLTYPHYPRPTPPYYYN